MYLSACQAYSEIVGCDIGVSGGDGTELDNVLRVNALHVVVI